jgi:hypothetical protein
MIDDSDEPSSPVPLRPKRPADSPMTHVTFGYKRIGKKFGVYKKVGVARVPPCPHCGKPYTGKIKAFLDRMISFGGATGGFLLEPTGTPPPKIPKDFPEQGEFDEKEILPDG